jgi:large subunit ribosomal protein L4
MAASSSSGHRWNDQGNASTLTRAQVSGGNRKPYRQKGTGNARQGSTRAPQFRHGGVVFGPRPHPYGQKVNRQMKRIALRSALSDKAERDRVFVLQGLESLEEPKTKPMIAMFAAMELTDEVHTYPSVLVLLDHRDEYVIYSMRNIPHVKVGHISSINVVELLKYDYLIFSPEALAAVEATYDDDYVPQDAGESDQAEDADGEETDDEDELPEDAAADEEE